jgi:drug/metabolite transporter (DMT)-like permease
MSGVVWGLLGVLATAVCYGVGTVLQAVAARRTDRSGSFDVRLFTSLFSQAPYIAGVVVEAAGFFASILALRTLPLFLVQAAVASSVGVTAVCAVRFLGAQLRMPEWLALAALGVGLSLLAASAHAGPGRSLTSHQGWLLLLAVAPLLGLGVAASRLPDRSACTGLAVAAGAAFGGVGVGARVLDLAHPLWRVLLDPVAWAIAGYGVLGLLLFAMSLQRGPVTTTAAVTACTETVLPAALGLLVLGDSTRSGYAPVAALGFVVTLVGAVVLARFAEPDADQVVSPDAEPTPPQP